MNSRQLRKERKKRYSPLLIASVLLAVLVLAYLGSAKILKIWPLQTHNSSVNLVAGRNENTAHPSPKNNNPPTKQNLSATQTGDQTTSEVPISSAYKASITKLFETNGQIIFSAQIANTNTAGICVVTFTNPNDRPVIKQFTATNSANMSTCDTTVSAYEFSYLGQWQTSLRYYVGDQQATADGTVDIQ